MGSPLRADVPAPTLEMVSVDEHVVVATFGNVLLIHFRRETPLGTVEVIREGLRSIRTRHARAVFFAVIEPESTAPDDVARRAFTRFFEEAQGGLAAAVITVFGGGFRGAAVRTIVSGIFSLAPAFRLSFPRHVAGTLDQAADWTLRYATWLSRDALVDAFGRVAAAKPPSRR